MIGITLAARWPARSTISANALWRVAQLGVLRTMKAKDVNFRAIPRRYIRQRSNCASERVQTSRKSTPFPPWDDLIQIFAGHDMPADLGDWKALDG
jgi:hypothetical protein